MPAIWKTQQWPQDWKMSVFIPNSKKDNAKECSNYHRTVLISHTSKLVFKLGFSNMWTKNFQMFQLDLEKAEEPEINLPTSDGSQEKAREFQKNICFIDYAKAFDCADQNKLWKILKEMGIPDQLTCSWETRMQVKKQQLELNMEQQTGSRLGKEYIKAVCCNPAYLTSMQSNHVKCWAGWIPGWNQDCQKKYQ